MNQAAYAFGSDINEMVGYAQATHARLGVFDLLVENTGDTILKLQIKEQNDGTVSGYSNLGSVSTIAPRGRKSITVNALSKRLGFFGSGEGVNATTGVSLGAGTGSAVANLTAVYHNKGDLRGAQIDLVATGRRNWSFDKGLAKGSIAQRWGNFPDQTSAATLGADTAEGDGYGASSPASE